LGDRKKILFYQWDIVLNRANNKTFFKNLCEKYIFFAVAGRKMVIFQCFQSDTFENHLTNLVRERYDMK